MKTKLTLSIEKTVIERAKAFAARHATSVSSLVEEALKEKVDGPREAKFVKKWRGRFKKASRPGDPRMKYLERRYS